MTLGTGRIRAVPDALSLEGSEVPAGVPTGPRNVPR